MLVRFDYLAGIIINAHRVAGAAVELGVADSGRGIEITTAGRTVARR
jgi:hypothetical protein